MDYYIDIKKDDVITVRAQKLNGELAFLDEVSVDKVEEVVKNLRQREYVKKIMIEINIR